MSVHRASSPPAALVAVKLMAALGVMLVLLAGIFFWGRLADDGSHRDAPHRSVVRGRPRRRGVRDTQARRLPLPLAIGHGIVPVAASVVLGLPMLRDDVANERIVVAAPADRSETASRARGSRNTRFASGTFQSIAHPGAGIAAVVKLANGTRVLTLTDFATDNGPDLRVYLSSADSAGDGELGEFKDLGALKGNKGDQQYKFPADLDLGRFSTVVIWCRAFSVGFTSAALAQE